MAHRKYRPKKPDHTGRTQTSGKFLNLPNRIFQSQAYSSLGVNARCLLNELIALFNGANNGSLYLSCQDAADRLGLSDIKAIRTAFEELQGRGLIAMTKDAHFSVKTSETGRARCWRLTWHPWPKGPRNKRAPSNEWERYAVPSKAAVPKEWKRVQIRTEAIARYRKAFIENRLPVVDSTTTEVEMPKITPVAVEETSTAIPNSNANQPFSVGEESSTHIHDTMGSNCIGWWVHGPTANLAAQFLLLTLVIHSQHQYRQASCAY